MKQITLFLALIVLFASSLSAATAVADTPTSTEGSTLDKKSDLPAWKVKLIEKFEKKVAKISKKDYPAGDNLLSRDAKWWLKAWIICWLGSIVFYGLGTFTVGAFWYVGHLLSLAGSVAFVIWVLKLLDAI